MPHLNLQQWRCIKNTINYEYFLIYLAFIKNICFITHWLYISPITVSYQVKILRSVLTKLS